MKIEKFAEKNGITDCEIYYREKEAIFYINPYEINVWNIIRDLEYFELKNVEINFANDKDDDYDVIKVRW